MVTGCRWGRSIGWSGLSVSLMSPLILPASSDLYLLCCSGDMYVDWVFPALLSSNVLTRRIRRVVSMLGVNDIQEMVMIMRRARIALWEWVCVCIDHAYLAEKRGNSPSSGTCVRQKQKYRVIKGCRREVNKRPVKKRVERTAGGNVEE